jgi:uncharacterized integral membrane protein
MRNVYIALVAILATIVVIFMLQNLASVTVSFLTMNITLPLSILALLVYALGMLTGGLAWQVVRTWVRHAARARH